MTYIETIKIENGNYCNLNLHLQRIKASIGKAHDILREIPEKFQIGSVKCRVVYNETQILKYEFSNYTIPTIQSLKLVDASKVEYDYKYADRFHIENLFLQKENCDDILMVRNKFITDTSFCNVIFQNNKGLFTPKFPLLKGVQREFLLQNKIICEKEISVHDICSFDSIYLINAMMDRKIRIPCKFII